LSGGELFDAICEQEFYKENDARRVMTSITDAVRYMHSHGVMHRDLKPENLILCSNSADTDLKLIDFGFATRFGAGIAPENRLCGTPGYVAPEMLRSAPYGSEVDMWSLGVIMYVLLAGMPPFSIENGEELSAAIQVQTFLLSLSSDSPALLVFLSPLDGELFVPPGVLERYQ
jgi:calcium/calmodulin-dependent protein kinase I